MNSRGLRRVFFAEGKISVRFRNANIALFTVAFLFMTVAMYAAFSGIVRQVSTDHAMHYAASSANTLSSHVLKEIELVSAAARSSAVTEWLADDNDNDKRALAYEELAGMIGELYSNNLYIGIEETLHEFKVDDINTYAIRPVVTLDSSNPDDEWYFDCIASDKEYILSVAMDNIIQRKRVWLDYKVANNGVLLGVISTGLDFSHLAGELFAQYDNSSICGLVVDENGIIFMDSSLLGEDKFMYNDFERKIEDEFSDQAFLAALSAVAEDAGARDAAGIAPTATKLALGKYRYATIAPIKYTNWSAVILYDPSSSIGLPLFLPITVILLFLLMAFAFTTNAVSYRLIFKPLEQLIHSLTLVKDNQEENIYGADRNDEFGNLSNTIQDLFTKVNHDALTGIYNRRYMESNLQHIMSFLSRSSGSMSALMIDVDHFKKYNDAYGHEQGDVCLKAIAQVLADGVARANDFVARYGGEEFVAILPNTDESGARAIAQKLLENVQALNIPHADSPVADCVTVSIGVTTGKVAHTHNWEGYLKCADDALYLSKQGGRNRYTYLNFVETRCG